MNLHRLDLAPLLKRAGAIRRAAVAGPARLLPGERAELSVITAALADRDGELVLPDGLDVADFRANPVVTFGHRYDTLPVGWCAALERDGDRLLAKTVYPPRPPGWAGDWLPDAVWHLVRDGLLPGKSIGFLPLEGRRPTPAETAAAGRPLAWVHTRALLLEYAVVPIPSNPASLVSAVAPA